MLKKILPIITGFLGLLSLAVIYSQVIDSQESSEIYIATANISTGDGMENRHFFVRQICNTSLGHNVLRGRVSKEEIEQISAEGKCTNTIGSLSLPGIEDTSTERIYLFIPLGETVRSDAPKLNTSACALGAIKNCPWRQIF